MPDLIPEPLTKELDIAGRKIPLYVPIIGAGLAILLVVVVKLRGGGGGGKAEPAPTAGPQPGEQFQSSFEKALATIQKDLAQQIETMQATTTEQVGTLQGQIAAATAEQAGLAQQISGFRGLLGEQQAELASGISNVTQQVQAYQSGVDTRLTRVEQEMSALRQQQGQFSPSQRRQIATLFAYLNDQVITPIAQQVGAPYVQFQIEGPTGNLSVRAPGDQWVPLNIWE